MKVGDLVIGTISGEIGIIIKIVAIGCIRYYWIYVSSSGKEQIFPHDMIRGLTLLGKQEKL